MRCWWASHKSTSRTARASPSAEWLFSAHSPVAVLYIAVRLKARPSSCRRHVRRVHRATPSERGIVARRAAAAKNFSSKSRFSAPPPRRPAVPVSPLRSALGGDQDDPPVLDDQGDEKDDFIAAHPSEGRYAAGVRVYCHLARRTGLDTSQLAVVVQS